MGKKSLFKVLSLVLLLIVLIMVIWIKILGATEVTSDVEKNGYCKQYGEDWRNKKGENYCYNSKNIGEIIEFGEVEFRDYCPKNKFLSTKFYSKCFHKSGGIA